MKLEDLKVELIQYISKQFAVWKSYWCKPAFTSEGSHFPAAFLVICAYFEFPPLGDE